MRVRGGMSGRWSEAPSEMGKGERVELGGGGGTGHMLCHVPHAVSCSTHAVSCSTHAVSCPHMLCMCSCQLKVLN